MPKPFSNINIEPNDDGTFQVNLKPWIDPKGLKKNESRYEAEEAGTRRFTINSLDELAQKIGKFKGKDMVEAYMNGPADDQDEE